MKDQQPLALKCIIEGWAGRYINKGDVIIAAKLLGLKGEYPNFNISSKTIYPAVERISHLSEYNKHPNYKYRDKFYRKRFKEEVIDNSANELFMQIAHQSGIKLSQVSVNALIG